MIFWLDAQLPPGLAEYLASSFHVEAIPVRNLGLRDASDQEIFQAARTAGAIVITKDSDFLDLSLRHGPPPQVLWLTCGNCSNRRLQEIFSHTFANAVLLFREGEPVVEISGLPT
jgi:predicted nuclease of predicted toxin-antitoxin system